MNALLLSAGEGKRLRPLTLIKPKCLLPVFSNNVPMLKYWIDILQKVGIDKIFINVYYLQDQIIDYVAKLETRNNIILYREDYLCPVGKVLADLRGWLGNEFLVINSDTYIPFNQVRKFIELSEIDSNSDVCICVEKLEDVSGKSFIEIDGKMVSKFCEKPDGKMSGYVWAGVCLMSDSIFNRFGYNEINSMELSSDIFKRLKMSIVEVTGMIDIGGSLEDYKRARKILIGKVA